MPSPLHTLVDRRLRARSADSPNQRANASGDRHRGDAGRTERRLDARLQHFNGVDRALVPPGCFTMGTQPGAAR